jgi:TolA-binding protein
MSAHDDDRVPSDLAGIFAAERERPLIERPGEEAEARLWSRVASSAGIGDPGSGGSGSGGDDGCSGGSDGGGSAPAVGAAVGSGHAGQGTSVGAASILGGKSWLAAGAAKVTLAVTLFSAGAATGVVVDRAVREPLPAASSSAPEAVGSAAPESASSVASAPSASAAASIEPAPSAAAPLSPHAAQSSSHVVVSTSPAPSASTAALTDRDADLAAERSLLERSRSALGRGDANGALAALDQHATRFPRGRLGEEREALRIQALLAAGRTEDAREGFERFRARHPTSLLVPALAAAFSR